MDDSHDSSCSTEDLGESPAGAQAAHATREDSRRPAGDSEAGTELSGIGEGQHGGRACQDAAGLEPAGLALARYLADLQGVRPKP